MPVTITSSNTFSPIHNRKRTHIPVILTGESLEFNETSTKRIQISRFIQRPDSPEEVTLKRVELGHVQGGVGALGPRKPPAQGFAELLLDGVDEAALGEVFALRLSEEQPGVVAQGIVGRKVPRSLQDFGEAPGWEMAVLEAASQLDIMGRVLRGDSYMGYKGPVLLPWEELLQLRHGPRRRWIIRLTTRTLWTAHADAAEVK